jgi:hypothetical protein
MLQPSRFIIVAALCVVSVGCLPMSTPGSEGGGMTDDMAHLAGGGSDALPATGRTFSEPCDSNMQCASMLCTKDSYDRLTYSICTYKCDPAAPSSPQCPNGCNMKGYCRLPAK